MSAILIPVGNEASNIGLLDVDAHIDHLRTHGRVFWNVNLPGTKDKEKNIRRAPWRYNNVNRGYFSLNKTDDRDYNVISHRFSIDYVQQIWELQANFGAIERYIPLFRRRIYDENLHHNNYSPNDYAILINEITPLADKMSLDDFIVSRTNSIPTNNPRNYFIVEEQQ